MRMFRLKRQRETKATKTKLEMPGKNYQLYQPTFLKGINGSNQCLALFIRLLVVGCLLMEDSKAWIHSYSCITSNSGALRLRPGLYQQRPYLSLQLSLLSSVATSATSERSYHPEENASFSPLSLTLEELSEILGGKGRAQACWDCFRLGVDPLWFFSDQGSPADKEPLNSVLIQAHELKNPCACTEGWTRAQLQGKITPRRQSQGLGRKSLHTYKRAFLPSTAYSHTNTNTITQEISGGYAVGSDSMESVAIVVQVYTSRDGTTKLLLELAKDKLRVEAVIIPWSDRQSSTLCLSNQVGCAQACTFCSTGRMGELRSLSADEILVQVYWASKICRLFSPALFSLDAIVFMGMGEAAKNVDHVVRSVKNLVHPSMFQLAPRRMTISTVAPTPDSFVQLGQAPAVLAWSVHASKDSIRKLLVPTTKYSMVELRDALINALLQRPRKQRQIMLELALIDGINDRIEDALHLADFCRAFYQKIPGVKLVVNLIPWNPIGASTGPAAQYKKPTNESLLNFQKVLCDQQILCYIRTTRGDDESAACGQLATEAKRR